MLGTGLAIPAIVSRLNPILNQGPQVLALAGVGDSGVTQGFTADPNVTGYTSTADRFRLAPTGFVKCAANEERLCYNSDGTFRGQYLQGADTYYSAPWDDPAAPHTSTDPAYLAPNGGGTIAYAGSHSEADIFGGTGGGVTITQTSTQNGFFVANNLALTGVVAGDVLRVGAIVSIKNATKSGRVEIGFQGNVFFGFIFDHDASGNITGFTDGWATTRAGYEDMGTINGVRCWYVWAERLAANTNNAPPRIGFGNIPVDTGKIIHLFNFQTQLNPATAPAAVPVCAAAKTFAADTLATTFSDAGYVCEGLKTARSQMPGGNITAPAVARGVPHEPLETRILILEGIEAADRSGILHNENQAIYLDPFEQPTTHEVFVGPTFLPEGWLNLTTHREATNYTVTPVFEARRDARPMLGRFTSSRTFLTGALDISKCILLGVGDPVTSYWEQVDVRVNTTSSFFAQASTNVIAQGILGMGASLHTTRARHEIQQDATPERQVYVGEFVAQSNGGTIDFSGSRFNRMARITPSGVAAATAVTLDANDTAYDHIWSDCLYIGPQGTFTANASRRFHGVLTSEYDLTMWQSRKQIEVDTGSGFVDFSASGLTLEDLPHGYLAQHIGTYDFGTSTFTSAPDASKAVRVRYWQTGAVTSPHVGNPGFEWHASQIDKGTHSRHPDQGDVFEIDDGTNKVRIYYDYGRYETGPVYVQTGAPALLGSGTHSDNVQVNRTNVTISSWTANDLAYLNRGQGDFATGDPGLGATGSDIDLYNIDRIVAVLEGASNGHRFDYSKGAGSNSTLANAAYIQAASDYRYADGSGISMTIGAAGANNTLNLGANVTVATSNANATNIAAGATLSGAATHIQLPAATSYDQYTVTAGSLSGILQAADIDSASGHAKPVANPWTFAFDANASAALGFDPNAGLATAKGDHQQWDSVITKIAAVYFREPDHYAAIAASSGVGTVVASGISASAFHAQYGANGKGYFEIVGTELRVAKALTGLNRVFALRGDNDETYVVDVA